MTDYYVANNGNDANDGLSREFPFRTMGKAIERMKAGDNVYMMSGFIPAPEETWEAAGDHADS